MAYKPNEIETIFNTICSKIAEEGKPVRKILKEDGMPSFETFYRWLNDDDEKSKQYTCACEARADMIFDDILYIADDVSKDTQTVDIDGIELQTLNKENIQRARLRVEARKWVVSKMNPKKFGDKIDVTSGNKEMPVIAPVWNIVDSSKK